MAIERDCGFYPSKNTARPDELPVERDCGAPVVKTEIDQEPEQAEPAPEVESEPETVKPDKRTLRK